MANTRVTRISEKLAAILDSRDTEKFPSPAEYLDELFRIHSSESCHETEAEKNNKDPAHTTMDNGVETPGLSEDEQTISDEEGKGSLHKLDTYLEKSIFLQETILEKLKIS